MSEDVGDVDICVQFSNQFAQQFELFLNTSSVGGISVGEKYRLL